MVKIVGTWLMGECEQNSYITNPSTKLSHVPSNITDHSTSIQVQSDIYAKNQGVLVKRCRVLEESKCASVCINSCKIPTQDFFRKYMGINLTMTPNYENGECQFEFGREPSDEEEEIITSTPCYKLCPSGGKIRKWHNGDLNTNLNSRNASCSDEPN